MKAAMMTHPPPLILITQKHSLIETFLFVELSLASLWAHFCLWFKTSSIGLVTQTHLQQSSCDNSGSDVIINQANSTILYVSTQKYISLCSVGLTPRIVSIGL